MIVPVEGEDGQTPLLQAKTNLLLEHITQETKRVHLLMTLLKEQRSNRYFDPHNISHISNNSQKNQSYDNTFDHLFNRHIAKNNGDQRLYRRRQGQSEESADERVKNLLGICQELAKVETPSERPSSKRKEFRVSTHRKKEQEDISHNQAKKVSTQMKSKMEFTGSSSILYKLEPEKIVEYLRKEELLTEQNSSQQAYNFFVKLAKNNKIQVPNEPLIKKYKNCIYFGENVKKNDPVFYYGMMWFYKGSFYYGQFKHGRKDGYGIEIDCSRKQPVTWRGVFEEGKKNGLMQVKSKRYFYNGSVRNGYFHGFGVLVTSSSIYRGNFIKGLKQGEGSETMNQSRVELHGLFEKGQYEGQAKTELSSIRPITNYHKEFRVENPEQYRERSSSKHTAERSTQRFDSKHSSDGFYTNRSRIDLTSPQFLSRYVPKELRILSEESEQATERNHNQIGRYNSVWSQKPKGNYNQDQQQADSPLPVKVLHL